MDKLAHHLTLPNFILVLSLSIVIVNSGILFYPFCF